MIIIIVIIIKKNNNNKSTIIGVAVVIIVMSAITTITNVVDAIIEIMIIVSRRFCGAGSCDAANAAEQEKPRPGILQYTQTTGEA